MNYTGGKRDGRRRHLQSGEAACTFGLTLRITAMCGETKQILTEILEEEGANIRDGYLEAAGDSLLVRVTVFRDKNKYESIREKTVYFKL